MNRTFITISAIITLFAFLPGASADEKMRIAIIDFQAKDLPENEALKVTELIRDEMVNSGRFIVIERSQMGEIMKEQGLQQTGCTDVSCAVQVGKLLSARKMLVGTVMKMGKRIIITGRIVDVEKGVAEFSERGTSDSEDDLYSAVSRFSKNLSDKIRKDDGKSPVKPREEERDYVQGAYKFSISANYSYMSPYGDFADLCKTGMGGALTISFAPAGGFEIGITGGYYSFPGKEEKTDKLTMIPFLATAGYRLSFSKFFIIPSISGGGIYASLAQNNETKTKVQNLVKGGLGIGYALFMNFYIQLNADYNMIFEEDGPVGFLSYSGGIGMRM